MDDPLPMGHCIPKLLLLPALLTKLNVEDSMSIVLCPTYLFIILYNINISYVIESRMMPYELRIRDVTKNSAVKLVDLNDD